MQLYKIDWIFVHANMGHCTKFLGSVVISTALLLACCTPATGARVSSGLLADAPGDLRQDVETASRAAEAASRRLQQEATTARLLPPDQVQFVVSADSRHKCSCSGFAVHGERMCSGILLLPC
jgi:hypothetical protein